MNKGGKVIFGGNHHKRVIGCGKVSLKPSICINGVFIVNALKHKLFIISQLCDNESFVVFNKPMYSQ